MTVEMSHNELGAFAKVGTAIYALQKEVGPATTIKFWWGPEMTAGVWYAEAETVRVGMPPLIVLVVGTSIEGAAGNLLYTMKMAASGRQD